jgi:hypothetical protein
MAMMPTLLNVIQGKRKMAQAHDFLQETSATRCPVPKAVHARGRQGMHLSEEQF